MKVFQGPVDVAWQASILARFLRAEGIDAKSVVYAKSLSKADDTVVLRRSNPADWIMGQLKAFFKHGFDYDIYHFHFAKSFLPFNLDLPILKLLGKKIVFHFHGCDIRDHRRTNVQCGQCNLTYRNFQQPLTKFVARTFADKVYVSTPDLLEDFPSANYLPVAYPWKIEKKLGQGKLVVHASTDQKIKGTSYALEAVDKLKKNGKDFDFKFIEGMKHEDAQKIFQSASFGIDQLLLGWYGLFSLEFLAQGKPVLCYINPRLIKYQKNLPILNTTPEKIYNDLSNLISDKTRFDPVEAVEFVKKVHSPKVIAERLIRDYQKL